MSFPMQAANNTTSINSMRTTEISKLNESLQIDAKALKAEQKSKMQSEAEKEQVYEGVKTLNNAMEIFHHKLYFDVHEETNRIQVAIIDKETNEVIKEIPSQEVLDMVARIQDMLGILVDERA